MQTKQISSFVETVSKGGAPPKAAAGYAAGVAYLWGEAVLRYLWTNTSLTNWFLYNARTGDVAAIWLFSVIISLLGFALVFVLFRKRERFGSIKLWTIMLVVSAIVAPMIGEIGTPFGI
ncbi:MAG TPA: LPXTG cell wall anchor domain-containing protein [Candidatus Bathyarchaeia archaeon]|jgi:LPXTG-motif cell wall-anchored protein|nr:LPXTG cell wall anchor domain-containing protein [Candidatus Bathyarchaeia archaeon]